MNAASSSANFDLSMNMDRAIQIPSHKNPLETIMSNINKKISTVQSDEAMKTFNSARDKIPSRVTPNYTTYADLK